MSPPDLPLLRALSLAGYVGHRVDAGARRVEARRADLLANEVQPFRRLFVKYGTGGEASYDEGLLKVEALGLLHLRAASMGGLHIPEPICVGLDPVRGAFICMEQLDLTCGVRPAEAQAELGRGLAALALQSRRLQTSDLAALADADPTACNLLAATLNSKENVPSNDLEGLNSCNFELGSTFGFPLDGCCGAARQLNNSSGRNLDWLQFWREYRLQDQLRQIEELHAATNHRFMELGAQLVKRLPELFSMLHVEDIEPTLLHGDLWSGNAGMCRAPDLAATSAASQAARMSGSSDATKSARSASIRPCIYDPAPYYGHSEADLGIARMFGGFSPSFWEAYHEDLPKAAGYERRALLYELHHHMNHYQIFGESYRGSCSRLMGEILKGRTF